MASLGVGLRSSQNSTRFLHKDNQNCYCKKFCILLALTVKSNKSGILFYSLLESLQLSMLLWSLTSSEITCKYIKLHKKKRNPSQTLPLLGLLQIAWKTLPLFVRSNTLIHKGEFFLISSAKDRFSQHWPNE